ncbi:MAG: hypothetical protein ABL921_09105 [Pirellula sp.]
MKNEGPLLETLLRRLSECPIEFVETCKTPTGLPQLIAILSDHFREFGDANPMLKDATLVTRLKNGAKHTDVASMRYWALLSVATWLLHDDWFLARPELSKASLQWLSNKSLEKLSEIVSPDNCISDPDRREELVRISLGAMGLRPLGESIEQATDRSQTLDSVEREGILRATAAAERRAREVREAMAKEQALESASRYGE